MSIKLEYIEGGVELAIKADMYWYPRTPEVQVEPPNTSSPYDTSIRVLPPLDGEIFRYFNPSSNSYVQSGITSITKFTYADYPELVADASYTTCGVVYYDVDEKSVRFKLSTPAATLTYPTLTSTQVLIKQFTIAAQGETQVQPDNTTEVSTSFNTSRWQQFTDFITTPVTSSTFTSTSTLLKAGYYLKYKQTRDVWAASDSVSIGTIRIPTIENGYAYQCTTGGTTNDTEGEPTWSTTIGATTTEIDGVVWTTIYRYDYARIESITGTTIAIQGVPMSSSRPILEMYVCKNTGNETRHSIGLHDSSVNTTATDVLKDANTQHPVRMPNGLLIALECWAQSADSTSGCAVNVYNNGGDVFGVDVTIGASDTYYATDGIVNPKNYIFEEGDNLRVDITQGGAQDASGVVVNCYILNDID